MIFLGRIEKGKFIFNSRDRFDLYSGCQKDGRWAIDLIPIRSKRSIPQNRYYWKILEIMSESLGYDREELHATFRAMFLTDKTKVVPLVRSTTKLSKMDFGIYLDKIIKVAAEQNIIIMTPEEFYASDDIEPTDIY